MMRSFNIEEISFEEYEHLFKSLEGSTKISEGKHNKYAVAETTYYEDIIDAYLDFDDKTQKIQLLWFPGSMKLNEAKSLLHNDLESYLDEAQVMQDNYSKAVIQRAKLGYVTATNQFDAFNFRKERDKWSLRNLQIHSYNARQYDIPDIGKYKVLCVMLV